MVSLCLLGLLGWALVGPVRAQTVVTWSSNSDQRWSRNANWSGGNRPDAGNEIAEFGTGNQDIAPLNQVEFQGWDASDTKWQSYDTQITPVPEFRAYGMWLLAVMLSACWCFRHRQGRNVAGASALSEPSK